MRERNSRWCWGNNFKMSTFLSLALAAEFSGAQLLDAIGHVKSGMNHAAVGDRGHSRGAWQISKTVWKKFSAHDWKTYAHRPSYSERVAAQYLSSRPAVTNQTLRVVSSRDKPQPRRRVAGPGGI